MNSIVRPGSWWEYEGLVAVLPIEDRVFENRDPFLSQLGHITLDIICLYGNVFETLTTFLEKLVDPRIFLPVLDQVQPALVAKQNASVQLLASGLIVTEVPGFQPENAFKPLAGVCEVPDYYAEMLNA